MQSAQYQFSTRPSIEWPASDHARSAQAKRVTAFALLIVVWIAVVDLLWQYTNMSILYVVPLALLAMTGGLRSLWRSVALLVLLTYAIYFLKYSLNRPDDVESVYLNFRLVNRTLVAASLVGLAYIFAMWIRWTADQSDPELTSSIQFQERELSATLAALCCVPLVLVIAGIDFVAPATYNLAILYPIPLFICMWLQSRRLLWGMLAFLLVLSAAAHFWGSAPPADAVPDVLLLRSRVIAAAGLIVLTALLSLAIVRRPLSAR